MHIQHTRLQPDNAILLLSEAQYINRNVQKPRDFL